MLMCLFVREGEYPPPPPNIDRRPGFFSTAKTYARRVLHAPAVLVSSSSPTRCTYTSRLVSMFPLVRNTKSLGLTMQEVGDFSVWVGGIALLLHFPAGWLVRPLASRCASTCRQRLVHALGLVAQCVWIFHDFGPRRESAVTSTSSA